MPEESPIRWLHLSDFHVGKDNFAERRIFGRIHEHIREQLERSGAPDLIFITGDLAQSGRPGEYSSFYEEFLLPLQLDILGEEWQGKVFTIPGNHDVDRSTAQYFDREAVLQPNSRFFDVSDEGRGQRDLISPRFRAYVKSEASDSPNAWLDSNLGAFAERLHVREHTLGIVGLNTAWLCRDEHDRHHLTPGIPILEEALGIVNGCEACFVLGHHPLDWLYDKHVKPIRALLGNAHAIYLHGHLHAGSGLREDGAGRDFLAIQSGACFQARDGEPWLNGLLWGELDLRLKSVRLQPRHWNPDNLDWPITYGAFPESRRLAGIDWWSFPLPGSGQETQEPEKSVRTETAQTLAPEVPDGWQLVDSDFLDARRKDVEEQEVLRFFDGSVPTWRLALSPIIPRRAVVSDLSDWLREDSGSRPRVALLVGPGGEGKTTAFFQAISTLIEIDPSWKVLWRHDDNRTIEPVDLRKLRGGKRWLIATDDADLIAQDLFAVIKTLQVEGLGEFSFLFACRDTDWRSAGGDSLPWFTHSDFYRKELSGLGEEDAQQIIWAWSQYGPKGLGQLAGKDPKEAVQALIVAATKEAELKEGAFFGAMLKVRIGHALREHLTALLNRLHDRKIHHGVTLRDAFAYIAAMHAEGLTFLSKAVLAQVLGCQLGELKPKILGPLGKEAAAVSAGRVLLTRHRAIARNAVDILSETFDQDVDELYLDLARAATSAREHSHMPEIKRWRYNFSQHFLESGRSDLAIRIGTTLLNAEIDNIRLRVHLAKLYREMGESDEAVRLFREYKEPIVSGALYEWGIAEGTSGNQPFAAWLQAHSLADQVIDSPPNNMQARISLSGLGVTFHMLFTDYNNHMFVDARYAVATLGLKLPPDTTSRSYFEKYQQEAHDLGAPEMDIHTAFDKFESAVRILAELLGTEVFPALSRLAVPGNLSFNGLRRLLDVPA
jgi:hypothetical protein